MKNTAWKDKEKIKNFNSWNSHLVSQFFDGNISSFSTLLKMLWILQYVYYTMLYEN